MSVNEKKLFKAGAATANITPPLGMAIVGGWGNPEAIHIHDELHARCLVLDDGSTKLVFVVVDNVHLRSDLLDEARKRIMDDTDIPVTNILISSTHTHSAVSGSGKGSDSFDEYQKFLLSRFVDVVKIAINNMEPAKIGWGSVDVPEHLFVRRWKMKPGTPMPNPYGGEDKVVMNPGRSPNLLEQAGVPDPEVSFLSIQSKEGRPIALLANYSLHYVGWIPTGHVSADYFAVFADRIQGLIGADRQDPPFVGIMSNGTSGDVSNIDFSSPRWDKEPYEQMYYVANDVANKVFGVYGEIQYQDWLELGAATEILSLSVRKVPKRLIRRSEEVLARPDTVEPIHRHEVTYARRILSLNQMPDKIDITLQAFRIGSFGIAAIPFEVFAETGLEIKERSPFERSFTIELANGAFGYLPTPEQHKLGGYETWYGTNKVEEDASVKIVDRLMKLFNSLK
ncbi:MAG: hypothetical protein CMJ19_15040 [Phycisphaeraceae bacterium]|nr:hypothetical protein [Phycisphaeraceae bacterium]